MSTPTPDATLIDEQVPLDEFCGRLADPGSVGAIACDTEFVRTNTYWPTLCLVQLAVDTDIVCLDVLAVNDVTAVKQALAIADQTWVLHAAKQDLEAMHSTFGQLPSRIIDTQIAAGLLGHPPQIGYANLVEKLLGIRLDKGETRTDWSRRPLTAAQLAYAAADVEHLPTMLALLADELKATGREDWVHQDCTALLDTEQYQSRPDQAWQRLSSIPFLPVAVQARARRLAAWRENRATQTNRPRKWILADKPLLQIAHADPAAAAELSKIDELPAAVIRKSGAALVEECALANADVAAGRIDFEQRAKPAPTDEKALKDLARIVREAAERLELAPELLATRKELSGLLRGARALRCLSGWRREIIGEQLLAAL